MILSISCSDLLTNSLKICMILSRYSSFFIYALILLASRQSRKLVTTPQVRLSQFIQLSYNNTMIELEEYINSSQIEQINADRMRKSSRLLGDIKSHQKLETRYGAEHKMSRKYYRDIQSWNWRNQKYSQLLKLIPISLKEEKEQQVTKSLDYNDHKPDYLNQPFKGLWKPQLESEILIAPCRQLKPAKKLQTESNCQEYRYKSKHECLSYKKDRTSQLNLFKFQLRKSDNKVNKKKRGQPSIRQILKIEDQPAQTDQNETKKLQELVKEGITLEPLRKAHERLKSITPEKKQGMLEKRSLPLKISQKRNHLKMQSDSLKLKKIELSAWTFHNIEQQNS